MVLDVSGLFYIVVVDSGLTCGMSFRDPPRFRYCMMVMASSRCFLTVQDICSCPCMVMAGLIWLLMVL